MTSRPRPPAPTTSTRCTDPTIQFSLPFARDHPASTDVHYVSGYRPNDHVATASVITRPGQTLVFKLVVVPVSVKQRPSSAGIFRPHGINCPHHRRWRGIRTPIDQRSPEARCTACAGRSHDFCAWGSAPCGTYTGRPADRTICTTRSRSASARFEPLGRHRPSANSRAETAPPNIGQS